MKRFGYSLQEAYSIPINKKVDILKKNILFSNKKVLIQVNLYPKVG